MSNFAGAKNFYGIIVHLSDELAP